MKELYTTALVLSRIPVKESDEIVILYTEKYGRIHAHAKSIRKITSKVSSQLQPLHFSKVRCIQRTGPRDGFIILDALSDKEKNKNVQKLIPVVDLILKMTHEWEADPNLWACLDEISSENEIKEGTYKKILSVLGFDLEHAVCSVCGKIPVGAFVFNSHNFLCNSCAFKIDKNEVIYII